MPVLESQDRQELLVAIDVVSQLQAGSDMSSFPRVIVFQLLSLQLRMWLNLVNRGCNDCGLQ